MIVASILSESRRSETGSRVLTHLPYLDGIRALAAVYVLVHHALLQIDHTQQGSVLLTAFSMVFVHGRYAVDVFIVLSGFSLMLPVIHNNGVLKGGALPFFKRRMWRILPPYYIAMLASLLLIVTLIGEKTGTNWDNSIPVTSRDIFTHLFLVHDCFTDTIFKINHTFWSVAVEFHIYFLFPLLVVCWRKLGGAITSAGCIVLSLVLWYALGRTGLNVYGMTPHYLALFAFGMFAAQIAMVGVGLWSVFFVLACAIMAMIIHPILRADMITGVCTVCFFVLVTKKSMPLQRMLSLQPLAFTGTFAYSIYLIHAPLLQLISQYVITPLQLSALMSGLLLVFVGTPLIIGCSYLFFLVAERPFLKKKKSVPVSAAQRESVLPV